MEDLQPFLLDQSLNSLHHFFEDVLFSGGNDLELKKIEFKGSSLLVKVIDLYMDSFEINYEERMQPLNLFEEAVDFDSFVRNLPWL